MCGIAASLNSTNCIKEVAKILDNLTIRGTDATGISFIKDERIYTYKRAIKPEEFKKKVFSKKSKVGKGSIICIGHNRHATSNIPKKDRDKESHPFEAEDGSFCLVHNGHVTEFETIRRILKLIGHKFSSGVDSEVYVHIFEELFKRRKSLVDSVNEFYNFSTGNILVMFKNNRILGLPSTAFVALVTEDKLLIASEAKGFKDVISDNADIYVPSHGAVLDAMLDKDGKLKINFYGKWNKYPFISGKWQYHTKCKCDFCGECGIPCESFLIDGSWRDRCLKCYKANKTIPKISTSITSYDNRPINTNKVLDIEAISTGKCMACGKVFSTDRIFHCSLCNTLFCEPCFNHAMKHQCKKMLIASHVSKPPRFNESMGMSFHNRRLTN